MENEKHHARALLLLATALLIDGCASRQPWKPKVDTYNDPKAYLISRDMEECRNTDPYTYTACLRSRGHKVFNDIPSKQSTSGSDFANGIAAIAVGAAIASGKMQSSAAAGYTNQALSSFYSDASALQTSQLNDYSNPKDCLIKGQYPNININSCTYTVSAIRCKQHGVNIYKCNSKDLEEFETFYPRKPSLNISLENDGDPKYDVIYCKNDEYPKPDDYGILTCQ